MPRLSDTEVGSTLARFGFSSNLGHLYILPVREHLVFTLCVKRKRLILKLKDLKRLRR